MPRGEDVFVRYYTRFVLEDPRFLRHGLTARAVFNHLSAVAVSRRTEFLPARYDAEALAISMRCTEDEASAGLEELITAKREPLVGRLSDGRLRVVDVRKCHGTNFRWEPEGEAFHAWALETEVELIRSENIRTTYPRTGTIGDFRGVESPESPEVPEVRGKRLDVDVSSPDATARRRRKAKGVPLSSDPDTTTTDIPATPDGVSEADWRRVLACTKDWPVVGRDDGLRRAESMLRSGGPDYAERWIRKADTGFSAGKLHSPWLALGRGHDPPDDPPLQPKREKEDASSIGEVLAGTIGPEPPTG